MINGCDFRVSEGLPQRCSRPGCKYSEAPFHPKTIQNAIEVVRKSMSQVLETNLPDSFILGGGLESPHPAAKASPRGATPPQSPHWRIRARLMHILMSLMYVRVDLLNRPAGTICWIDLLDRSAGPICWIELLARSAECCCTMLLKHVADACG